MFGKGDAPAACNVVLGLLVVAASIATGSTTHAATHKMFPPVEHDLGDIDPIEDEMAPASTTVVEPKQTNAPSRYVTLMIGGDLGFGASRDPVVANGGMRHGRRIPYAELTRHIKPIIKSDLVFANLETVVTATNALSRREKKFNFRMHPNGVAHLVGAGFNVLSTANNHSIDYGTNGMRDTLKHLASMKTKGLLAAHGIAATRDEMFEPSRFAMKGARFAFSALGIGGVRATSSSPGQVHFRSRDDFERMSQTLGAAKTDYRMLSVHYGEELQVRPSKEARAKLAGTAVSRDGVDLVIGHHAHTPAGVQRVGDRLVFYGLGNLLHMGMRDMNLFSICRDFGVMARLHLVSNAKQSGRLVARAVEIIALDKMNSGSRMRRGGDGRRRIEVINYLGAELGKVDPAREGVRFQPRPDGSGLYCAPGADQLKGAVGKLCSGWRAPSEPGQATRRRLASACRYRRKSVSMAKAPKLRNSTSAARRKRQSRAALRAAFRIEN
jgi:Bacterial capsule synthesis protein PGA_cap